MRRLHHPDKLPFNGSGFLCHQTDYALYPLQADLFFLSFAYRVFANKGNHPMRQNPILFLLSA